MQQIAVIKQPYHTSKADTIKYFKLLATVRDHAVRFFFYLFTLCLLSKTTLSRMSRMIMKAEIFVRLIIRHFVSSSFLIKC